MATWLKQSTAVDIAMGPFVDSVDGNTIEGSLTITQPDIRLKKNGGAWAQKSAAQTLSHEEAGWYEVALSTTDTDTLGILVVAIHESGALPVWREFMVVPAQVWDSFLGADILDVSVTQWLGQAVAAVTVNGVPEVDVTHWLGNAAAATSVNGVPEVDVTHWVGGAVPAVTVTGVPEVDVTHWIGTAAATPTTAGVPEVDITHIAGAAVSTSSAQLGVNVVSFTANAITATAINADAITAGKIADGAIDAATFATGAITATAIATDAIGAAEISAAAANKIADHVWRRTYANARASADGDAVAFRSPLGAIGKLVNKWVVSAGTLTVYQEDDTTSTAPGGTQTVASDAAAEPITGLDT